MSSEITIKCPKCHSENVVEFGANEPDIQPQTGLKRRYRAYDCKDCGHFFRIKVEDS